MKRVQARAGAEYAKYSPDLRVPFRLVEIFVLAPRLAHRYGNGQRDNGE